ncbi:MAG: hypothetical protein Rubg2KO_04260 [Rubricoccaceae bacterium]
MDIVLRDLEAFGLRKRRGAHESEKEGDESHEPGGGFQATPSQSAFRVEG